MMLSRRRRLEAAFISRVADVVGARCGLVTVDEMHGGGLHGPFHVGIRTIRQGDSRAVVDGFHAQAAHAGYVATTGPNILRPDGTLAQRWPFKGPPELPGMSLSVVEAGDHFDYTERIMPAGTTGLYVELSPGLELAPDGRSVSADAAGRLAALEVGGGRVPGMSLMRQRVALRRSARRVGAFEGRVLESWFVGIGRGMPCTFGVTTVRPGSAQEIADMMLMRTARIGGITNPGQSGSDERCLRPGAGRLVIRYVLYGPGERVLTGEQPIAAGQVGVTTTVSYNYAH